MLTVMAFLFFAILQQTKLSDSENSNDYCGQAEGEQNVSLLSSSNVFWQ
jgi:hypothetical protein